MAPINQVLIPRNVIKSTVTSYLNQNGIRLTTNEQDALCKRMLKKGFSVATSFDAIFKAIEQDELFSQLDTPDYVLVNRYIRSNIYSIERIASSLQRIRLTYHDEIDKASIDYSATSDMSDETTAIRVIVANQTPSQDEPLFYRYDFHNITEEQFSIILFKMLKQENFPQNREHLMRALDKLKTEYHNPNTIVICRNGGLIDSVYANHDTGMVLLDKDQHEDDDVEVSQEGETLYLNEYTQLLKLPELTQEIIKQVKDHPSV